MYDQLLLSPPVAFFIVLAAVIVFSWAASKLAFSGKASGGKNRAYACGEDMPRPRLQPDYAQFFPFAFFFTIMHVVALTLATAPQLAVNVSGILVVYAAGALIGIFILYRREQ